MNELIKIKVEAIKISSCNLTNFPFLYSAAKSKLPILLSTGMANFDEVNDAVKNFQKIQKIHFWFFNVLQIILQKLVMQIY